MRTSEIVSSRRAPEKPGAMTAMSSGVARTPISTSAAMTSARSDATAPGDAIGLLRFALRSSDAYTGMNDADSA